MTKEEFIYYFKSEVDLGLDFLQMSIESKNLTIYLFLNKPEIHLPTETVFLKLPSKFLYDDIFNIHQLQFSRYINYYDTNFQKIKFPLFIYE